ncbi:hypothetical protein DMC14_000270 [Metamycoplasma phocicerebrale]|uniref:Variable surface lipoprotein n=1 Tax=Metamycoplasma phocicerebrale TaxID=142649 RepID=A0A3Q9V9W6_9BACT|nr:hypothetical protein [Metamycoplasma phocicerebrale]AZZ65246.1 hypothetical protein DMC14_000270 [Metamycoplasma phocicerebrale]
MKKSKKILISLGLLTPMATIIPMLSVSCKKPKDSGKDNKNNHEKDKEDNNKKDDQNNHENDSKEDEHNNDLNEAEETKNLESFFATIDN